MKMYVQEEEGWVLGLHESETCKELVGFSFIHHKA